MAGENGAGSKFGEGVTIPIRYRQSPKKLECANLLARVQRAAHNTSARQ